LPTIDFSCQKCAKIAYFQEIAELFEVQNFRFLQLCPQFAHNEKAKIDQI
jgi:hypothetical protein